MTNWNSKSALEWEWEKLAGFSPKVIDILKQGQPSNSDIEGDGGVDNGSVLYSPKSSFSASADSVLEEGVKKRVAVGEFRNGFPVEKDLTCRVDISGTISCLGASQSSGQPQQTIGLKLGKRTYFEGFCAAGSPSISVAPTRRSSRASYQSAQTPHCQVEGCNLDLKLAKDYHRRHRICEMHSKSPKVIVAGMERRFCQQCSRFHELSEFDDKKRSCRRRLSEHNARRRRPQPETIQIDCSSRLHSSLLYDKRQQRNLLVNREPSSTANPTRQSSCSFKVTQGGGSYTRPLLNFPAREMVNAPSSIEGLGTSAFDPGLDVVPDFGCADALSLLSTNNDNTLGLNNSEANNVEMQLMQVNQTLTSSSSSSGGGGGGGAVQAKAEAEAAIVHYSLNNFLILNDMINNISIIPLQEFQLLKAPYNEPAACSFYSNQITSTTAEAAASCKSSFLAEVDR